MILEELETYEEEKERVIKIFSNLFTGLNEYSEIHYSKGYKIFEETYQSFKKDLGEYMNREEIEHLGWTEVVITLK